MNLERKLARQKAKLERAGPNQKIVISGPPIAVISRHPQNGDTIFRLFSDQWDRYEYFGLIVADLVRQIANCFNVTEEQVWFVVDLERHHQTSPAIPLPDDYTELEDTEVRGRS
jgi:hypothetical protein